MELLQRLDQQIVDRKPDRAAPVRVAAEQSGARFGRLVVHAVLGAVHVEHVGMVRVRSRERADAVGRKEFVFVEHDLAAPAQLVRSTIDSSRRSPCPGVRMQATLPVRSGRLLDEPLHPPLEARQLFQQLRLQRLDGEQRNQARPSTAPSSGMARAVGQVQHVVEEAVLLVPQSRCRRRRDCSSRARCRGSAPRTCWPRLRRPDPRWPAPCAIASRFSAVHRHPARAVGLLDVAAGRQRRAAIEHADVVQAEEAALEDVLAFGVLAIHPPGEVQQQLVEDALEKRASPSPRRFFSIL